MPAFVKTKEDEETWERAKERAEEQGEKGNWAYVTSLYKSMKGGKVAAYPEEFTRAVENIKFRQPSTGNRVKFVSLTPEEQAKVYSRWQQLQQQKAQKKKKKPKRPTFAKAREGAFGALEEDGWSVKKDLKVPKARKDIDGDEVILHFKPQAVYMEVKGKAPPRSLHTDIRDVDPKQWAQTLEKEAKDMIELEERFKYGAAEMLERLERVAAFPKDFMQLVKGKRFRNPKTDNHVRFVSLPAEEQKRIYDYWKKHQHGFGRGEKGWVQYTPKIQRLVKNWREHEGLKGMKKKFLDWSEGGEIDDEDLAYLRRAGIAKKKGDGMTAFGKKLKKYFAQYARPGTGVEHLEKTAGPRWRDLGPEEKEAARHAFSELFEGPPVRGVPIPGQQQRRRDEEPPEPPPPAEVKKMLANRMRSLARKLMVAGMRAPRQQMVEIGKALEVLLDQLDLLADQPGRQALRRRVLMNLRQRIVGGM